MIISNNYQINKFFKFKDHPTHFSLILGGMFSIRNTVNRDLSSKIFELVTDRELAQIFNKGQSNEKMQDQNFLEKHVFELVRNSSVIHDSYLCEVFAYTRPWPTKRRGNCFVGKVGVCNETGLSGMKDCPVKCRPLDHIGWLKC